MGLSAGSGGPTPFTRNGPCLAVERAACISALSMLPYFDGGFGAGFGAAGPPGRADAGGTALAGVPSGLILNVTSHMSTHVAAVPPLWVLPVGLHPNAFPVSF